MAFLLQEDGALIQLNGENGRLLLDGAVEETGTTIENTASTTNVPNNYLICDRTGFKMKLKHGLREEWNGPMVRGDSWEPRNVQDFVKSKAESLPGPLRPEGGNSFVGQSGADTAYLEYVAGGKVGVIADGFLGLVESTLITAADL